MLQKDKMVDGVLLATILKEAFEKTFEQMTIEKTNRMLTLDQYIEKNKTEYADIFVSEDLARMELKKEYYEKIIEWIKQGNKISEKAYNSLPSDLQFHFNKHYNYRGDKILITA